LLKFDNVDNSDNLAVIFFSMRLAACPINMIIVGNSLQIASYSTTTLYYVAPMGHCPTGLKAETENYTQEITIVTRE